MSRIPGVPVALLTPSPACTMLCCRIVECCGQFIQIDLVICTNRLVGLADEVPLQRHCKMVSRLQMKIDLCPFEGPQVDLAATDCRPPLNY
jgi:hypothetical protein